MHISFPFISAPVPSAQLLHSCASPCGTEVVSSVKVCVCVCVCVWGFVQIWVEGDHTRGDVHPAGLLSHGEGTSFHTV